MPMVDLSDHVRRFLEKPNVAVLATISRHGRLQATPVWFLVEDGQILINTSRGRVKLRNLQAEPHAVLTIVDRDNPFAYVQIYGRAAAFDREHGGRDIDRLSLRYRGKAYTYPSADRPENRVTILIAPERVLAHLP